MVRPRLHTLGLTRYLLGLALLAAVAGGCKDAASPEAVAAPAAASTVAPVAAPPLGNADLPGLSAVPEGDERQAVLRTVALIRSGGPFPFPRKDGTIFQNRERRLPQQPRGYYHEFTVPTPGVARRGPRRLVSGSARELYYTRDHYKTFSRLTP